MTQILDDDQLDLGLDYQLSYDTGSYPDLITPEYIGTPVFPAPCHATVFVIPDRVSNIPRTLQYSPDPNSASISYTNYTFEYYHYVGEGAGWMYLDYKSWDNEDIVEVYHNGLRIATTLDPQQARGYLKFYYDPKLSQCYDVMVRISSQSMDSGDPTSVYYSIWCPNVAGARELRHGCSAYTVYSAGHPVTEDNFYLGQQSDERLILAQVNAGNQGFTTTFELYASDDRLLDTTTTDGTATLEYYKDINDRTLDNICVRATGPIGCDWSYFVWCPIQPPIITVPEYNIDYSCNTLPAPPDPNQPIPPAIFKTSQLDKLMTFSVLLYDGSRRDASNGIHIGPCAGYGTEDGAIPNYAGPVCLKQSNGSPVEQWSRCHNYLYYRQYFPATTQYDIYAQYDDTCHVIITPMNSDGSYDLNNKTAEANGGTWCFHGQKLGTYTIPAGWYVIFVDNYNIQLKHNEWYHNEFFVGVGITLAGTGRGVLDYI
jgi:hypothetical protein